jgi:sugar-phosphatase
VIPIPARALLFDMDGLMVDSEPLWFEVERDFVLARGGEWTQAVAHACIGKGLANAIATMRDVLGLPLEIEQGVEDLADLFLSRASTLKLKPGCVELFDAARDVVPIALASSSKRRIVEGVLDRLRIRARFDAVVTGDDVVHAKPAPDIFLEASRRLQVAAPGCIVLEDSLAGATAGHAAKMPVIAVPETETPGLDLVATAVVRDLYEARAILQLIRPAGAVRS